MRGLRRLVQLGAAAAVLAAATARERAAQETPAPPVELTLDCGEAEAVLALVEALRAGEKPQEADWERLRATDGYRRLRRREESMGRPFTDEQFRRFVESPELSSKAADLAATLARWKELEVARAGRLALAYLPSGARIRARVFPVIKPQDNTFVFEPDTDPAIFFSIDPAMTREKFENTLAHELHHIGYASCCPRKEAADAIGMLPPRVRAVHRWIGAFGEGFAMLAAAGGPDVHPHSVSPPAERAHWDRDVARFDADLRAIESFYFDVLDGRLTDAPKIDARGMSFFGVQGPWYTVGWRMAISIEKAFGRERLLDCMADPRLLLPTFNEAADQLVADGAGPMATWSEELIAELERG